MGTNRGANRGNLFAVDNPVDSLQSRKTIMFDDQLFYELDIKGYFVSRNGDVISCFAKGNQTIDYEHPRYKKLRVSIGGYYFTSFYKNGRENRYDVMIHNLVCETFIGPRPDNMQIDHINGNRLDNRLQNLRYVTRSQNMANKSVKWRSSKIRVVGKYNGKQIDYPSIRQFIKDNDDITLSEFCSIRANSLYGKQLPYRSYTHILLDYKQSETTIEIDLKRVE